MFVDVLLALLLIVSALISGVALMAGPHRPPRSR